MLRTMLQSRAFTLLECVLVMAIIVALLVTCAMGFHTFVARNTLSSLIIDEESALRYARVMAIVSHHAVTLKPIKNDDWQSGQIIVDMQTQKILRVLPAIANPIHFFWKSTLDDSLALMWRPDGMTAGQQGSFYFCNIQNNALSAQIIILRTGRLRHVIGAVLGCQDGP